MATGTTFNSASDVRSNPAAQTLVQNWWLFTLRGVLGIVFGLIALIFPGPTMLSLVLLFSAYMLVDGVFGIISAVRAIRRKEDRWGLLIFEGLLNIAVGILAFLWPGITVVAFVWLIAAWPMVAGSGRAIVSRLWRAAYYHAADRSHCTHLVAGSIRTGFWRRAGHILFQTQVAAA